MFQIFVSRIFFLRYYSVFKIPNLRQSLKFEKPLSGFRLSCASRTVLFLFQEAERFHIPFPLVGSSGLEPPTSRLSGVRSNHLSYEPISGYHRLSVISLSSRGGDEEDRTPDPLRARQVLSQLSYTPIFSQGLKVYAALTSILFFE